MYKFSLSDRVQKVLLVMFKMSKDESEPFLVMYLRTLW